MSRSRAFTFIASCAVVVLLVVFWVPASSGQTLNVTSVGFGSWVIGATSTAKTVVLTNTQTAALSITGISASGDFAEASTTCPLAPNTLGAGAQCHIVLTFTPTVLGSRAGALTVSDSGANSPQTAALSGIGVLPVSLSTTSLPFPNQLATTTSAARAITVSNNQTNPLAISGISISGDFAQTSNCPQLPNTLAARTSCTVSITFTPTALGTRTGTLAITDNASTSPQQATVTGTGSLTGLSAIAISPGNPTVFTGHQQQLTATGTFTNHTPIDVTNFVTWASNNPASIQVNASGLLQALTAGQAMVVASSGAVVSPTTVTAIVPVLSSIVVTPANSAVSQGAYQQLSAALQYTDGTTRNSTTAVTWTSSSAGVAPIDGSGLATGLSTGNTTIQATLGSTSGSTMLTVSQPSCTAPPAGLIAWWTGDGNTVDIAGNQSGTLHNGAGYTGGEVAQAFSFTGNGAALQIDSTVYLPTAGTVMFWFLPTGAPGALTGAFAGGQNRAPGFLIDSSGNLNWEFANLFNQSLGQINANQWNHVALTYATVDSQTSVRVYLNGDLVANAVTDVNDTWYPHLEFGAYLGAAQPSFIGSIDEIAIFSQDLSSSQIQQIYRRFSSGMCKPTIQSIAISPLTPTLAPRLLFPFTATGSYSDGTAHDVTTSANWSTTDTTVADINSLGVASANAAGSTTVSAGIGGLQVSTILKVQPSLVSIQITPQQPSLPAGTIQPIKATGTFTDGSQQDLSASVNWTSSALAVAGISPNGDVTCLAAGKTTLTATALGVSGSTQLTVTSASLASIAVSPANPAIGAGVNQQFKAMGTFKDGSQRDVTTSVSWTSSGSAVATIDSSGVAQALAPGQVTITASGAGLAGTANLTVTNASLASIQITPASPSIMAGGTEQFSAIEIFSDGSSADITPGVTWQSSVLTVAGMSNSSQGLAVSTGTGNTRISAVFGNLTASTTLTVKDQLVSIAVAPSTVSLLTGDSQQFSATGTYASGVTQDLTTLASWSSSVPGVATVSSSGLATTFSSGQAEIHASSGGVASSGKLMAVPPDPLGTVTASSIACKNTSFAGNCFALAISCPNTSDLTGYIEVIPPVGTPLGTVLFSTGGNGIYLWETYKYGKTILQNVVGAGLTAVEISWGTPYNTLQPSGWQTGPGGIRATGCRYATLAQWVYTNIHLANAGAPFCATGNSGGSEVLGLALTHYGMGSIFALVEPTSGPPFARQDLACDCQPIRAVSPCGVYGNYCVGPTIAQNFIDPAYPSPLCSQEITNHTNTFDAEFLHDSVVAPDSVYAYPNTNVRFLFGDLDSAPPPNQGHLWENAITSSKAESCVPNSGHTLPNYVQGAQQISNDIIQFCKLPPAKPQ